MAESEAGSTDDRNLEYGERLDGYDNLEVVYEGGYRIEAEGTEAWIPNNSIDQAKIRKLIQEYLETGNFFQARATTYSVRTDTTRAFGRLLETEEGIEDDLSRLADDIQPW